MLLCVCCQIALADQIQVAQGGSVATNITPPRITHRWPVYYPIRAQRNRLEGEVELEFVVSTLGVPQDVRIIKSSGSGLLDFSAQYSVLQWQLKPARQRNKRLNFTCRQTFSFKAPAAEQLAKLDEKATAELDLKMRKEARVLPIYPPEAMATEGHGTCEVVVYFAPNGSVTNVALAKTSGRVDLDFMSLATAYHHADLTPQDPQYAQLAFTNGFRKTYRYRLQ